MTAVSRLQSLGCYQDDVHEVTNEEKTQGGELEQAKGGIAKIEPRER